VALRDVTAALACFALWGPTAPDILAEVCDDDLSFAYMAARRITVGDVPCLALRVTYVGEKGWELYTRILDNLVLSNSSGAVSKFVNDGEAAIGLSNEDVLLKYKQGGGPVEILYPTDGTTASADGMALLASPPNPEGGKQFMNYMLSHEAQVLVDGAGRRAIRTDVVTKNSLTPLAQIPPAQIPQARRPAGGVGTARGSAARPRARATVSHPQ